MAVAKNKTGLSYIRDAEIEHTLRSYATPLFVAAGLNPEDVSIHLVNNKTLNAFVAGGQRLFFFTGLLERVEHPGQLKGVIAHETGHIAGGHLARTHEALKNASIKSIIGYVLGAAAIVAGGGQGGAGIIAGSQAAAQKSFLKYNRTQESAADQAAIRYLESTGQSGKGMLEFLGILGQTNQVYYGNVDPYWLSHPISSERVRAMEQSVRHSVFRDRGESAESLQAFDRMQAKLQGFIHSMASTLKRYPETDLSVPARYARAIAYFRRPVLDKALLEINSLIDEFPADPYFHELKGQMLYENGDIQGALPSLEAAATYAPNQPLILTLYGTVLLSTGYSADDRKAIDVLKQSVSMDAQNPTTWNQLAIAYGRMGDTGNLALATAERFILLGQFEKAIFHAKRAQENMRVGSPGFLRADDIITIASRLAKN
ncbi:M48 family metalloprotease [Sneathiella chinensis]|uniref:Peptidase M48 n=1 Tax=Sneathiella chinensis TaxID=349750 RepID=A0ABQ5U5C9_9PROT|nr:M48 family metalloprotease [Sneathiella chinensis]GLQ07058.1 peptidase M48 [Sneathiella chinensis]